MAITEYITTFLESIKKFWQELDIKKWAEQVGGSSAEAVEAAIYFGLSFSIGFLFKKYLKVLLISIIITFIAIKALEHGAFLTINWEGLKAFFGITGATDFNTVMNHCFDWIKAHLLLSVASTVGFLVGYKLG